MNIFSKLSVFLFVFVLVSCSENQDNEQHLKTTSCDRWAVMDAGRYKEDARLADIQSLELTGDCLSITFAHSGCSGETWEVALLDAEQIEETAIPQRNLRLSIKSKELCEAYITKELSFDLSELRLLEEDQIILNILGVEESVLYTY